MIRRPHANDSNPPHSIFGFLAFVLIGLEQEFWGCLLHELGAQLRRSPEELGLFFALHGVGSCHRHGSALIGWLEKRNNKRIAMAASPSVPAAFSSSLANRGH